MVCAEYFRSQTVVVATLTRTSYRAPQNDEDYYLYTFSRQRLLRGEVPATFDIWEGNDSGRATFGWRVGQSYVLFMNFLPNDHTMWQIDGCGNSGPEIDRGAALAEIDGLKGPTSHALIAGQMNGNVQGVQVQASGDRRQYQAVTDRLGRFRMRVLPGQYQLRFAKAGWSFEEDSFSYEDPDNIQLQDGACAQVYIDSSKKEEVSGR